MRRIGLREKEDGGHEFYDMGTDIVMSEEEAMREFSVVQNSFKIVAVNLFVSGAADEVAEALIYLKELMAEFGESPITRKLAAFYMRRLDYLETLEKKATAKEAPTS